ncbi:ATP-binding cassette domain-containing protein [Hespellia stercorisuis]|uniref:Ribose transport system ATP-binding protein n=1 Tax=Hespellia stercorisuis DSM 15480 TaxID=1121950 RepID=A0A1M6MT70_9FIRM|nr:ATP-binding cassette domain-containing protein [Hespellia stercorisuis]SHJ86473.1 ribose transport system ATP-binding protein [Hespellia stercorisuis DSM 15480]
MEHKENQKPYLQLKSIDKFFGITKALQGVNLDIYGGEVIGLIGPNGAGKSTLMKILTGVLQPTNGVLAIEGKDAEHYNARTAKEIGIACAYQDLSLCTNLSVYENFALLNVSHGLVEKPGWRKAAKKHATELLEQYFPGSGIDVSRTVDKLSLADQQIVEICKTLMTDNLKILILDEPTSALSSDKAHQLHEVVAKLSKKGVAVIYISHKLDEIGIVADRIAVLRNGQNHGEISASAVDQDGLVEMMGGGKKKQAARQESGKASEEIMVEIKNLTSKELNHVDLVVKKGEILGISGLAGSGQQELLQAIYSARKHIGVMGRNGVQVNSTISYVSGDRTKEGVFPLWDIRNNILAANFDRVRGKVLLDKKKCDESANYWYDKLKFRAEGIGSNIMSLSGGNQQKALIARGIASEADIIILNDPTAGVDIGTKQDIYALLEEVKQMGKSVILYSTEDAEIEICDRAYIMHEGAITAELTGADITVSNIVTASFKKVEKKKAEDKKKSVISQMVSSRLMLPILTLLVIFIANAVNNPNMLSYVGLRMKISSTLPLIFAALGQMFIILSGDCDMGNGYSIGLVNVLVGTLLTGNPLVGLGGLVIFIAAYMGMAALIHLRNIPAIVVTLGAQFVWYGIALILCPTPGGSCPQWLSDFLRIRTPVIPFPIILAAVAGTACWYLLARSRYGMVMRGIGNNPTSVERSGWSYLRAKAANYGMAGLMIVFAGMAYTSTCNGADANSSVNFCMMSIATVILGGCEMAGGVGEPIGVVVAAIAMNLINSLLTAMKVDSNYQTAIIGLILIAVLAFKFLIHRKGAAKNE